MSLSLLLGEEETSRFYYVLSTYCIPLQVSGVALCSYADVVAVNDELALFNVSLDSAFKLADISQKSLTQTLRTLEVDGFVTREVFPEVPPRVVYSLTPRALSFLPLVENIIKWAMENMEEIIKDREKNE